MFDGTTGKLTYITGLPDESTITGFSKNVYNEDGKTYVIIVTETGYPAVYCINHNTATATRGLEIQATTCTAIGVIK
jgi:hypothetical protein